MSYEQRHIVKVFALGFLIGALALYILLWVQVGYKFQKTWCMIYDGNNSQELERCEKYRH